MAQGAEPQWSEDPYAQAIKRRVEELGWQKKDLAAALVVASEGRLKIAGAQGLVGRVTKRGIHPQRVNRELLDRVLELDHPQSLEGMVIELTQDVRRLTDRVEALERQAPPGVSRGDVRRRG